MADTSKKRSRKAKLVPRFYDLTEDEPNELLTNAISSIEDTTAPDPVTLVLPKIKNKIDSEVSYESTSQSDRFSVEIEVETIKEEVVEEEIDHDEDDITEEEINSQSFLPLSRELNLCRKNEQEPLDWLHRKDVYYQDKRSFRQQVNIRPIIIPPEVLKREVLKAMAKPSEYADKQIEIELKRNMNIFVEDHKPDFHETKVQDAIMSWRIWANQGKSMRHSVFIYKCLPCNLGMWHLDAFQEHIRRHDNVQLLLNVFTHHECAIVATCGASFESMCLLEVEDTCWRCLKTYQEHLDVKRESFYYCVMCYDKFATCLSLFIHEGECMRYQKKIFETEIAHETFWRCDVCHIQCLTSKRYNEHLSKYHTVRSDLFIEPSCRKTCLFCQKKYYVNNSHLCRDKPFIIKCRYCLRKFQNRFFKYMHESYTKSDVHCKICRKYLPKECMELEHLMKHTTKYVLLFRCTSCAENVIFLSVKAVLRHQVGHAKKVRKRKTRLEPIIVPKSVLSMKWPKGVTPSMMDLHTEIPQPTTVDDDLYVKNKGDIRIMRKQNSNIGNSSKQIDSGSEDSNSQRDTDIETDAAEIRDMLFNTLNSKKKKNTEDNQIKQEEIHMIEESEIVVEEDYEIQGEVIEIDEFLQQNVVKQECLDQDKEIEDEENEIQKFLEMNIIAKKKNMPESCSRSLLKHNHEEIEPETPEVEMDVVNEAPVVKQERLSTEDESVAQEEFTENQTELDNEENRALNKVNKDLNEKNKDVNEDNQDLNEQTPVIVKEESLIETENAVASLLSSDTYQDDDLYLMSSGDDYLDNGTDPISEDVLKLIKKEKGVMEKLNFVEEPPMKIKEEPVDNEDHNNISINEHLIHVEIKRETESPQPWPEETGSAVFKTSKKFKSTDQRKDLGKDLLESLQMEYDPGDKSEPSVDDKSDDDSANFNDSDEDDDYIDNDADDPDFNGPDLSSSLESNVFVEESKTESGGMIYTCLKCGFRDKYKQFKLHRKICKRSKKEKREYPLLHEGNVGYPCTKCNKTFNLLKFYLEHIQTHGFKKNMCPTCYRVFPSLNQMSNDVNSHIRRSFLRIQVLDENKVSTSKADGLYQCKTCKERVEYGDFFRHWESHLDLIVKDHEETTEIAVRPEINEYSTMSPQDVKNVLKQLTSTTGRRKLDRKQCGACLRKFTRHNDCKRHLIEHLLKDAYAFFPKYQELRCQYCQEGFDKADLYKRHMRHHGEMPIFKCEICDRTFSDSSNFAKHKKVHNYQTRTCNICFKKFTSRMGIEKHMEMHRITSPIKCELCFQVFYTESMYKKHYKLKHDKERESRFSCKICRKKFRSLKNTWDHMWEAHKERKYKADCPLCNKSFRKYNDVRQHVKKEHYVRLMRQSDGGSSSKDTNEEDKPMEIDEFIDHMSIDVNEETLETLIIYEDEDEDV